LKVLHGPSGLSTEWHLFGGGHCAIDIAALGIFLLQ
jgi:hypothetical protein